MLIYHAINFPVFLLDILLDLFRVGNTGIYLFYQDTILSRFCYLCGDKSRNAYRAAYYPYRQGYD